MCETETGTVVLLVMGLVGILELASQEQRIRHLVHFDTAFMSHG